jgi:hypothetical protein
MLSIITIAGISPPVRIKSPIEIISSKYLYILASNPSYLPQKIAILSLEEFLDARD